METTLPQKQLRILLITARADHGGGPRHILDLLRAFQPARAAGEIEFYIGSPDQEPYGPQFHQLTKEFFEIPSRSFSPFTLFRLLRVVRRARIDVIHSHGRGAGVYSRLLGFLSGVRVLHTFHGIHRDPSVHGRIKLLVDQFFAFFSFTPIYVSKNEEREAFEFGCVREGTNGHVIENAVDTSRFKKRKSPPFSDSTKPIGFGAFLRPDLAKGPDLFLRLATDLAAEGEWSCAGISREELASYGDVPLHLDIQGRLREPTEWLQSLDVFVSTARNEGLPLGVLEAMAAGCACILSDIPAHQQFAHDGSAILFNPLDSRTFLTATSRIESDPKVSLEIIENAGLAIDKRYSLSSFAKTLKSLYLNV